MPSFPTNDSNGAILGKVGDWLRATFSGASDHAYSPLRYGAAGNGTTDDRLALNATLTAAPAGAVVDLGGRAYNVGSGITIGKAITLRNGSLSAVDNRVALVSAAGVRLENVNVSRTGTVRSGSFDSAITVNAENARFVNVNATTTIGDALHLANGTCTGAVVDGGSYSTSDPNDSYSIQLRSGTSHNFDIRISRARIRNTGYGTGVGLYNCSRTTVEHCDVRGIRRSPWFTVTGWALVSGTVYRALDRTDVGSNAVYVNGVEYRKNSPSDTTTPALNYYTTPGDGYIYINTGVNPSTQTVTTTRTSGYGILMYATSSEALGMSDNLIAHNYVEDTDGFGIYYQTLMNVPKNNRTLQNTLRNVCKLGIAVNDLPFAAIGVFGGLDVHLEGDHIDGAGSTQYPCPGIDFKASTGTPHMTGRIVGVSVKNAAATGVQLSPGTWSLEAVNVEGSKVHGISHGVITSTDKLHANLIGCISQKNTLSGVHFERSSASSGAFLRVTVSGGQFMENQRNIVLGRCQEVFVGAGVYSAGQSAYGISIGAFCTRVVIDGVTLNGQGLSVDSNVTDLFLGAVNHDGSAGTKLNIAIPYRVGGVKGYGSEQWVGAGTPEAVTAAPVGAEYRRTDGAAGTTLYVKETGTGNTGWVAK